MFFIDDKQVICEYLTTLIVKLETFIKDDQQEYDTLQFYLNQLKETYDDEENITKLTTKLIDTVKEIVEDQRNQGCS